MTDTRNVKVISVFNEMGIAWNTYTEATTDSINEFANASNRAPSWQCARARVVAKKESFSPKLYLTEEENFDKDFYHQIRYLREDAKGSNPSKRAIKAAHVYQNIQRWLKVREANYSICGLFLEAGWWRKGSSQKELNELAALLRCLHRCILPESENDESPYADADNGQLEYMK